MSEDGTVWLEFSSIDGAGRAYRMLLSSWAYRGCKPFLTPDPCILPVNTLLPLTKIDSTIVKEEPVDKERSFELELFETSALDAEDDIETAGGVTHREDMLGLFRDSTLDAEDDIETIRGVRAGQR